MHVETYSERALEEKKGIGQAECLCACESEREREKKEKKEKKERKERERESDIHSPNNPSNLGWLLWPCAPLSLRRPRIIMVVRSKNRMELWQIRYLGICKSYRVI